MPSFSFDIDPYAVLGVTADASLQEIRDAYRSKTKKFHPDVGGEDWAFRILVQSYELLSTNRVVRATRGDEAAAPRPTTGSQHAHGAARPHRESTHKAEPKSESVYLGIVDSDIPAQRRAAVELLSVRYLWEQASYLWLGQKSSDDDRFLSCSLNVSWPDRAQGVTHLASSAEESEIIASLGEVFDHLVLSTRAVSSRSIVHEDGFEGWLTYSNFDRTWKAVRTLQESLHSRRLGIRQWSRDLFIPRNWS
ncbi:J domain-containing protein [Paludisphaera rhizosphaerae]|uniref:J domain-containing protein n=1 Tax=Paludisphaera rhizosphaerae TaxID=2711216 RepID=UPI0013ED1533|nr:J domain-containing protein [Paludisphaera rhizosphaerae]